MNKKVKIKLKNVETKNIKYHIMTKTILCLNLQKVGKDDCTNLNEVKNKKDLNKWR